MSRLSSALAACLLLALPAAAQPAKPTKSGAKDSATPKLGEWSPISFAESIPMADAEQLRLRMHAAEQPNPLEITQEGYMILVPKSYKKTVPHGLIVWVSPSDNVSLPKEWEKVLDDKKLIVIGARKSGNNRDVFDRMRLAVIANHHMRGLYNIDDTRVYASGFSGGARVASMLGVTYADMFTGALCFMGVNFYTPTFDQEKKEVYEARYIPNDEILAMAKSENRYALITGDKDFNLNNTKAVFAGFQQQQFKAVEMFTVPGQAHSPPPADWLKKAIEFVDGKAGKK